MCMGLIEAIPDFDEHENIILFRDDIDLSSSDSMIGRDDLISFLLEIASRDELSLISDTPTRRFFGIGHY